MLLTEWILFTSSILGITCWYLEKIDKQDAQKISSELEKKLSESEKKFKKINEQNNHLLNKIKRHDSYYKNTLKEYIEQAEDEKKNAKRIDNKLKKIQKECNLLKEHLRNKKGHKRADKVIAKVSIDKQRQRKK